MQVAAQIHKGEKFPEQVPDEIPQNENMEFPPLIGAAIISALIVVIIVLISVVVVVAKRKISESKS